VGMLVILHRPPPSEIPGVGSSIFASRPVNRAGPAGLPGMVEVCRDF